MKGITFSAEETLRLDGIEFVDGEAVKVEVALGPELGHFVVGGIRARPLVLKACFRAGWSVSAGGSGNREARG